MSSPKKLVDFMMMIGRLKATKRTGWVLRGVKDPESVASHMYRMALMAFLAPPKESLSKDRCIRLSLVHDMAECIVGDLTPNDGVSKQEKHKRERAAMEELTSLVGDDTSKDMMELWQEYENQSSEEARFVKDLDRFDMVLQAYEYEVTDRRTNKLQEFFDSTQGKFQSPEVKSWVDELNKRRAVEEDASSRDDDSRLMTVPCGQETVTGLENQSASNDTTDMSCHERDSSFDKQTSSNVETLPDSDIASSGLAGSLNKYDTKSSEKEDEAVSSVLKDSDGSESFKTEETDSSQTLTASSYQNPKKANDKTIRKPADLHSGAIAACDLEPQPTHLLTKRGMAHLDEQAEDLSNPKEQKIEAASFFNS